MLDSDLAKLYQVETKQLKRQVRRNIERFPGKDFMFELTPEEYILISRSQNGTLKQGYNIKYAPMAFTELGISMLSSVLNSALNVMKVTIRKTPLTKGRHRLVLNYYPPVLNPHTNKRTGYENLQLFVYDHPSSKAERTHNQKTLELSNTICATQQLDLQAQLHGLAPNFRKRKALLVISESLPTGSVA